MVVSGVDSVGYPYVDIIVGGVPGLGIGEPPAVTATQVGQSLPVTTTWALSAAQPLAVVLDAPAGQLEPMQGIVAELVQAVPPDVPMSLVSIGGATAEGTATAPSLNRDAFMRALGRQPAATGRSVSGGVTAAAAAGVQHVFVITTCESTPPTAPPAGIVVDVLGIGATCTPQWRAGLASDAGGFVGAGDIGRGLAALDKMVTQWRSSVVIVAQALSRDPMALRVGDQRVTASLTSGPAAQGTSAPSTGSSSDPRSAPSNDQGASRSGVVVLVLGLLLLASAVVLALVWRARRRRSLPDSPLSVGAMPVGAMPVGAMPVGAMPGSPVHDRPVPAAPAKSAGSAGSAGSSGSAGRGGPTAPPRVGPKPATSLPGQVGSGAGMGKARPAALVIDLREAAEPGVQTQPVTTSGRSAVDRAPDDAVASAEPDAALASDEAIIRPLMAVATPEDVGQAGQAQPATIAARHDDEEPVAMADEQAADAVQNDETVVDEAAPEEMPADEAPADEAPADEVPADEVLADEVPADEVASDQTSDEVAAMEPTEGAAGTEEPAAEVAVTAEPQPAAAAAAADTFQVASEFSWSALEFTPLVWRYDAEPEAAATIDLRESAAVDLREESGRRAPRRKKARR